ncbi:hypothetical protein AYI69_g1488 [Smittium culicis]|uniref:Uncharacterized protein n=1 Tax=Smittium culicis TaxID=133412 RepID=A0A1R1YQ82_9FUNG|nr:hypothetical protein AYI69_g1488 [Smittium culicis]
MIRLANHSVHRLERHQQFQVSSDLIDTIVLFLEPLCGSDDKVPQYLLKGKKDSIATVNPRDKMYSIGDTHLDSNASSRFSSQETRYSGNSKCVARNGSSAVPKHAAADSRSSQHTQSSAANNYQHAIGRTDKPTSAGNSTGTGTGRVGAVRDLPAAEELHQSVHARAPARVHLPPAEAVPQTSRVRHRRRAQDLRCGAADIEQVLQRLLPALREERRRLGPWPLLPQTDRQHGESFPQSPLIPPVH